MGTNTKRWLGLMAAILMLGGCAMEGGADDKGDEDEAGKEDRWNAINNPARFEGEFNYHLADLPRSGTAEREAWPSTYWATYEDSISVEWQRTGDRMSDLSPAAKYDMAFNGWRPSAEWLALRPFRRNSPVPGTDWDPAYYDGLGPLARHVSQNMGNRRDREAAVANNGRPSGEWPVETWWGLCHAWAPAAILEDRPLRAVTHNGVRFEVGDLEALIIATYNQVSAEMIGGRCNSGSGDNQVERDEHGRAIDVNCRDSNPGAMHVILTNYLGLRSRGFLFDRTYDYEVWNQPVSGYEITRQEEITVEQANQLLGLTGETYTYNRDAAKLYRVHATVSWLTESHASRTPSDASRYTRQDHYTYILEVDANDRVIGGEWFGNSRRQHPDFLWNPRRVTRSPIPNLNISDVRMLIAMSRAEPTTPGGGSSLTASGTGNVAIPDNNPTGIASPANVSGTGVVATVRVTVDLTHTYIGDLLVELEHDGVRRTLHNREGGSADDIRRTFNVVGFEGAAAGGTWTLHVSDRASRDVGTLNSWSIEIGAAGGTPTPPPADTTRRFDGQGGVAIPDNTPAGISSTATVAGVTAGTVSIDVGITHTWVGDLLVTVEHNGRTWTLHDRAGGNQRNLVRTFTLDATGNAFTGDPSGTWTLRVADTARADVGTLDRWSVVVR
ncbi:MAG: proprotein convertase P-domain-containing protein [Sandaracinaceae bacterium]|nr:proprotein convertase P-domain-containing protein [Sandaracinaceae bacterium]